MDDYEIEEWDDWHKDLKDWENHQDELDQIASKLFQKEYWNPAPDWLQEWKDWYKKTD
nr:hypothetical protein [uncultured Bacteroides sp.]